LAASAPSPTDECPARKSSRGDPPVGAETSRQQREAVRAVLPYGQRLLLVVPQSQLNGGEVVQLRGQALGCEFSWTVEVEDADFYVIEIANREGPTYSRADLEEAGWTVGLTIGE
jgi:hypothetical protein